MAKSGYRIQQGLKTALHPTAAHPTPAPHAPLRPALPRLGAALLGITYVLVHSTSQQRLRCASHGPAAGSRGADRADQQTRDLHLLLFFGIALGIMAVASVGLGWIVAGRILGRLRTMTATARTISASNLHERLAFDGPDDELKELGDTFDGLLGRLESSFDAQRQFVANASHELRTPLTLTRAMLQVALADPDLSLDSLRATCEEVLEAQSEQERLLERSSPSARARAGSSDKNHLTLLPLPNRSPRPSEEAEERGLEVHTSLKPAPPRVIHVWSNT